MKKTIIAGIFFLIIFSFNINAQEITSPEKFGKSFNLGVGTGYYRYAGYSTPVIHVGYEFDVAKNLTLAPFINYCSYLKNDYWEHNHYPYRNYTYRETVMPIGFKGTYYFDNLLKANSKWDFYLASSLGFAILYSSWDNAHYKDEYIYRDVHSLYFDMHIGAEYHVSQKAGLFLDLSSGVSTFGLAIHL